MKRTTLVHFVTVALLALWVSACGTDTGDSGPVCGDGLCESGEDCGTDCGSAAVCGDGLCEGAETATNCSPDCASGTSCGNGTCEPSENLASCPADCAVSAMCGDGTCDATETTSSCPADCGLAPVCGDGTCDANETATSCPADCGLAPVCGDGTCDASETATSCPADCGLAPVCGDGTCDASETATSCPADCGTTACGDGTCGVGEDPVSCPADCSATVVCGDGTCSAGEDASGCPVDCTTTPSCGDGTCNGTETAASCPADCGSASWTCDPTFQGDGECDCGCGTVDTDCADATVNSCLYNNCPTGQVPDATNNALCVTSTGPTCGDGTCDAGETAANCPADCSGGGWTCDPTWLGDSECDCGCGTVDTDCADATVNSCLYNNCPTGQVPDATNNALCVTSTGPTCGDGTCDAGETAASCPADCGGGGWTCDPTWLGDSECDCGCGTVDTDCADATVNSCLYNNCPTGQVPAATNNGQCVTSTGPTCGDGTCDATETAASCPADCGGSGWTCDPTWLGDTECDCGCGTVDTDCASAAVSECLYNNCPTGQVPAATNNALCVTSSGPVCGDGTCDAGETASSCPADCGSSGWTCDPTYYGGADGCDCGCGAVDTDCTSAAVSACDYNNCPTGQVPDATNNALCVTSTGPTCGDGTCDAGETASSCPADCGSSGWTCDPTWQGDGDCDCGCGIQDSDCASGADTECTFCDACMPTTDCVSVVNDTQNWLCQ